MVEGRGNCGNRRTIVKDRKSETEREETNADSVDHKSGAQVFS